MTIGQMKDAFEALIGKEIRLVLMSPKTVYEGQLFHSDKDGFPYKIRVRNGNVCGWLIPSLSVRVAELTAL